MSATSQGTCAESQSLTTSEGEEAFPLLVVPHFDLVVVASGAEDGLGRVEADTSDRSWGLSARVVQSPRLAPGCGVRVRLRLGAAPVTHRHAHHTDQRGCPSGSSTVGSSHCATTPRGGVPWDLFEISDDCDGGSCSALTQGIERWRRDGGTDGTRCP